MNTPYYYDSARELGKTVAEYLRTADDNYVIIEDGEALKWSDNGHPIIYGSIEDAQADKGDATVITERKYIEEYLPCGMQYPMFHVIFETLDESGDNVTEWTSLYESEDENDALSYASKWVANGRLNENEQLTVQEVTCHGWERDFEGAELLWFYTYEMQCERTGKTYEVCPHCGEEVELDAELKVQTCPNCGKRIVTCSVCMACDESGDYCKKCALCYQANAENGEKQDEPKNEPKGLYMVATEVVRDGMKKDGTGVELFATYANALRRYNEFVDGAIKANPNKPYGTQDTPKDGYREHNFELWREDEAFFCEHTSCTLTKMNVNE